MLPILLDNNNHTLVDSVRLLRLASHVSLSLPPGMRMVQWVLVGRGSTGQSCGSRSCGDSLRCIDHFPSMTVWERATVVCIYSWVGGYLTGSNRAVFMNIISNSDQKIYWCTTKHPRCRCLTINPPIISTQQLSGLYCIQWYINHNASRLLYCRLQHPPAPCQARQASLWACNE